MKMNAERVANELAYGQEEKLDKGWRTFCPCHTDDTMQLTVWDSALGTVRYKCNAGCKASVIKEELICRNLIADSQDNSRLTTRTTRLENADTAEDLHVLTKYKKLMEQHTNNSTDFLQKEIPEPKYIISPIIRENSLNMVYAKAGEGKSWFTGSLGLLGSRRNYHDLKLGAWCVENPCGALLADGELPEPDLQTRLKLLTKQLGVENPDHPLVVFPTDKLSMEHNVRVNLGDQAWRTAIKGYLQDNPKLKLLIIDNIASLSSGVNENVKGSWDPINQWLLDLRRMGVAVILVHHSNKAGGNRGHSCHVDNLDTVIQLKRVSDNVDTVRFEVNFEKGRHLKPGEGKKVKLELVGNDKDGLILVPVDDSDGNDSQQDVAL